MTETDIYELAYLHDVGVSVEIHKYFNLSVIVTGRKRDRVAYVKALEENLPFSFQLKPVTTSRYFVVAKLIHKAKMLYYSRKGGE